LFLLIGFFGQKNPLLRFLRNSLSCFNI